MMNAIGSARFPYHNLNDVGLAINLPVMIGTVVCAVPAHFVRFGFGEQHQEPPHPFGHQPCRQPSGRLISSFSALAFARLHQEHSAGFWLLEWFKRLHCDPRLYRYIQGVDVRLVVGPVGE
jgi:hypothetical protein